MDCRTFHRNLEDYLEDGLDFAGRFGMERHADQCITCGKNLADARKLRSMTRGMSRVKAPRDFEAALLAEIGRRKAQGRFSGLRRSWMYGFEWPSLRNLALVSSGLAVVGFGIFLLSYRTPVHSPLEAPPQVVQEPAPADRQKNDPVVVTANAPAPQPSEPVPIPEAAEISVPRKNPDAAVKIQTPVIPAPERVSDPGFAETDYVEFQMMVGPDNRPVSIRTTLPFRTRTQSGQTHEDYYIRNISH